MVVWRRLWFFFLPLTPPPPLRPSDVSSPLSFFPPVPARARAMVDLLSLAFSSGKGIYLFEREWGVGI